MTTLLYLFYKFSIITHLTFSYPFAKGTKLKNQYVFQTKEGNKINICYSSICLLPLFPGEGIFWPILSDCIILSVKAIWKNSYSMALYELKIANPLAKTSITKNEPSSSHI